MTVALLPVDEQTTPTYQATLREYEGGPVVPGSALTSIKVWLFEAKSGTIINSRNGTSLATNLVDENGVLLWTMAEEDTTLLSATHEYEIFVLEFEVRWDTPERVIRHRVDLFIQGYVKIPVAP